MPPDALLDVEGAPALVGATAQRLIRGGMRPGQSRDVEVVRVRSDRSVRRLKGRCIWVGGRDWRLLLPLESTGSRHSPPKNGAIAENSFKASGLLVNVRCPAQVAAQALLGPSARVTIVLAGLGASFLASFDLLIVVSALPSAARDVGNIDNYALAAGAYSVASVVGMPLAGIVNDRIGPLRTLLVGSGVFFVGTVVGGTATSMDQIAAGRLLQGFGGGFLLSVPLVLWTAYLPRHLERYGFAVNAAVWAISAVIGPPTALLVALVDWRAVFWVNLPLLALTLTFALRGFRGRAFTPHPHARANILGPCLLGGFALGPAVLAPWPAISLPASALAFLWQETHTDRPLIPRHRSGYATCLIALSAGVAFTGGTTVITLALQAGSGWSVFWASFPLLASSLTWTIGTGLVTHLDWSLRRIVTVGTAVVAAGTLAMAIPVSGGGSRSRSASRSRASAWASRARRCSRPRSPTTRGARGATRAPSRPRVSSARASARRSRGSSFGDDTGIGDAPRARERRRAAAAAARRGRARVRAARPDRAALAARDARDPHGTGRRGRSPESVPGRPWNRRAGRERRALWRARRATRRARRETSGGIGRTSGGSWLAGCAWSPPAASRRHQGGRPCTQRPPAIVAAAGIWAISWEGRSRGSRSKERRGRLHGRGQAARRRSAWRA